MRNTTREATVETSTLRSGQRRWLCLGVAVAAVLIAAAPAGGAPFVYATIPAVGKVSEFDAAAGGLALLGTVASGASPFSVAVTPDGASVYVANANDNTVSEYDVAADGALTPKTPATIKTGKSPIAIAVNPDGKSVYVVDDHDNTVSQYDVGPGGVLSPTIPATVATGGSPADIAVSPDGRSVYVTDFCCDFTVSEYNVGAGDTLTPKTAAPVRTGVNPDEIAVAPDGKSAYVTNFQDNTVSQYDIGAGGALTSKATATVASGSIPAGIAVSPDSQSVYVADAGDGDIAQYAATTSGLVLKTPETIGAGRNPARLVVSPDGKHVYVTDSVGSVIWQYSGGNGPGTLSPLSPLSVTIAPASPVGIAIGPAQIRFSCAGVILACLVQVRPLGSLGGGAVIIRTTIVRAAPVGILVQRIVGKRRVRVGRVPFGLKDTGRLRIRWNLRVDGHKLRHGRYLITLRMFDRHQHLIALAHPVSITVK
jgi:DNA-binding beta-propeller fold protein YncE